MALKKEALTKIATLLKIKQADLEAAIKDEKEIDVTIDEKLTVLSEAEVTTLKNNEYNNGKEKGVEMAVKEAREKLKLEFQGKTIDGLVEAAQKKAVADAKVEPNEKVTQLEQKVTTLQTTVQDYEKQIAAKDTEVDRVHVNSELIKHIPAFGENGPAMTHDDVIAMMERSGFTFKRENGKTITYKDGKQVQDKLSNAKEAKDVLTEFMVEKKLITKELTPGGRGGSDAKPAGGYSKLSEIKAKFIAEGKSQLGDEFSSAVEAAAKENKDFKMD